MNLADFDALEGGKARAKAKCGKARKGAPLERVVQRAIIKDLRALGFRVVHVPNGGEYKGDAHARLRMAMAKRADGEVKGFPDLIVMRPLKRGTPAIGFLEVKREGGTISDDQLRCHAVIASDGFPVATVCTRDGAIDALKEWGWLA